MTIKPGFVDTKMTASFKSLMGKTRNHCIRHLSCYYAIKKRKNSVYLPCSLVADYDDYSAYP
ncbi:MAG: hypothetical protein DRR00_10535 [Candidatus Parabeggiatoa sp. nov. 3]|nr:MAG: hypothetical protein DRR00_10535 [Gammaproteobacteria bacterium]RKZ65774.1 MAG: hypothetical protein DRQ99_11710 [Gammaproteobacteria bacterium]